MKAAVITAFGRPPAYTDFADPQPTGDALVATIEAAALKNLDRGLVSGNHYASAQVQLPSVAGVDGIARMADGSRVYTRALAPFGMMAEYALIDPRGAVQLPEDLESTLAAALPNPGLSAWAALEFAGKARTGQHILVLGATGATGSLAVQLAKTKFGAGRVVAAGRDSARLDWLRTVGADATLQLGDGDLAEQIGAEHRSRPFDIVIDYLWGGHAEQALQALGQHDLDADYHLTRYVQVGSMAGPTITLPAGILRSAGIELVGSGAGSVPAEALAKIGTDYLPALFAMLNDGRLVLDVQPEPLSAVERL